MTSDPVNRPCGVPQASVLGPVLFLSNILSEGKITQQTGDASHHLFAAEHRQKKPPQNKPSSFYHFLSSSSLFLPVVTSGC